MKNPFGDSFCDSLAFCPPRLLHSQLPRAAGYKCVESVPSRLDHLACADVRGENLHPVSFLAVRLRILAAFRHVHTDEAAFAHAVRRQIGEARYIAEPKYIAGLLDGLAAETKMAADPEKYERDSAGHGIRTEVPAQTVQV